MSSLDDWSPPVSPSIYAAMELDIVPDSCPSQIPETPMEDMQPKDRSPSWLSDLSDLVFPGEDQVLEDMPIVSSTQIDDITDGQRWFSVPVKLQTDLIPLFDDLSQMLKIGSKLLLQTQNGCFKHKVLNMNDTEIQWACDPLGHTQAVHSNHYRQRSTFIQRVKMAKLVYLQDMNLSPKVKEKGLDDSELNDQYVPVPFCCKKWRHLSEERLKSFKRFLSEPSASNGLAELTEIFSIAVVDAIFLDNMQSFFYNLKQTTTKIHKGYFESDSEYYENREQITLFYSYLKSYILKYMKEADDNRMEDTLEKLTSQLHSVVMYVDRLSDMKLDIGVTVMPCDYNRFHLNLDLYWNTLEILYLLDIKFKGSIPCKIISSNYNDGEPRSLLTQMVNLVLWELIAIATDKFQKKQNQDLLNSSPFECQCIKDLWKMVACLLNHKDESFWISVHEIVQVLLSTDQRVSEDVEIDSDVYMYPPADTLTVSDNGKFCMWMMTELAIVVKSPAHEIVSSSNFYDVNNIVKKILSKGEVNESDLRFYLKCCQKLCTVWEPNINLLVIFWDYFYKRLNNTFQLRTVSIDNIQTVSKTALDLLEKCKSYSNTSQKTHKNETSFQMYLCLLCYHLRRLVQASSMQEWKQMKGRIYSKFHLRRIQELTETGLNHFTNLFLCLALTADLEDVSTKLCSFFEMIEVNRQNYGKITMTWKGIFAVMFLYLEKNLDIQRLGSKLATAFNNICLEFEVLECEPGFRHGLWKLINVYLDGVQEIFDSCNDFTLNQHVLIGEGYSKLLKICRSNEVPTILTGLQDIISKIRLSSDVRGSTGLSGKSYVEEFFNVVMSNIYPALQDLCTSQTAQIQLADIIAEITSLAIVCKPEEYFSIMKFMLQSENINKSIVCRYLSHIVTMDTALDLLSSHMTNYQTMLIQTWIRCAVVVPANSSHLQALSRSILSLPDIRSILIKASYTIPGEQDKIIYHFFKAVQNLYDKLENWQEKIKLRDQVTEYVTEIHRHIAPYIQALKSVEALSAAYSVVGYLVKCCAHLLYVKSKPNCPLPDILNTMIVPHTMFIKDKPSSPVFLGLVRDHLHLFIIGLSNLDFKRDPFIHRRLKDICTIYMTKFWNFSGGTTSSVHPLVMSLKGSYARQTSESALSFRQCIIDIVKESFLTITTAYNLPENYQMAMFFVRDVTNRTVQKEVIARDLISLVCPILSVHLLCESISTQQLCSVLLHQLFDAGKSHPYIATKELVADEIIAFISKFRKIKMQQAIRTLTKLPNSGKCYLQKALPRIEFSIVEYEAFKGSGQDQRLRQAYAAIVEFVRT